MLLPQGEARRRSAVIPENGGSIASVFLRRHKGVMRPKQTRNSCCWPVPTTAVMPEVHPLSVIRWALFATLTLKRSNIGEGRRKCWLITYLRQMAEFNHLHFKRLIWVARYEVGPATRGHIHLCLAGKIDSATCQVYSAMWPHGLARIEIYDPARDGIGYILKRARTNGPFRDEEPPMLSESLFVVIRRGPMRETAHHALGLGFPSR